MADARRDRSLYTVGIICALKEELAAVNAMFDDEYSSEESPDNDSGDTNYYVYGRIGNHHVVATIMAAGIDGNVQASGVATNLIRSFENVRHGVVLMVGICGGVWSKKHDIRLGDVVVSKPTGSHGGVVEYHRGKIEKDGEFKPKGTLSLPPQSVLKVLNGLESNAERGRSTLSKHISDMFEKNQEMIESYSRPGPEEDRLYQWHYTHRNENLPCLDCHCDEGLLMKRDPRPNPKVSKVFYGTIGCADIVMKDADTRNQIATKHGILAFEMEAGGVMGVCAALAIRGVCDYADTHKNDQWHNFAAVAAAAYAKELLYALKDSGGAKDTKTTVKLPRNTPTQSRRESRQYDKDRFYEYAKGAAKGAKEWSARWKVGARTNTNLGPKDDPPDDEEVKVDKEHKDEQVTDEELAPRLVKLKDALAGMEVGADRTTPGDPIEGTCEWILKNEVCQTWLNEDMGMLWVVGGADHGQSNMSHFLFQRLQKVIGPGTQLTYYRCGGGEKSRNTATSMLRNVLWQIVANVEKSGYTDRKKKLIEKFGSRELTNKGELWNILLALAEEPVMGPIYSVLDGLYELDQESIDWLMRQYKDLFVNMSGPGKLELKVVIASQKVDELQDLAQNNLCAVIDLADNKAHVMSDLEKIASEKLRALKCSPRIEGEVEKRLLTTLVDNAEDSYIYVDCVIKEMVKETTPDQIEERLNQIPRGLDPYLRDRLRQIYDRGRLPAITQILRLVAIAVRPLDVTELAEALRKLSSAEGLNPADQGLASREELDEAVNKIHDYIDQCSPLLEIRGDSVFFANETVKAFLFNKQDPPLHEFHIDRVTSNFKTAYFCIQYMKQSPLKTQSFTAPKDDIFNHWPGLRYSMLNWCRHAKDANSAAKDLIQATDFMFDTSSELRDNWWQTYVSQEEESKLYKGLASQEKKSLSELDKTTPPPLHMFSRLGLDEWVRYTLDSQGSQQAKIAVNTGDAHGVPPLMWAAIEGHVETAKILIAAGANVDVTTTLQPKSVGSQHSVVRRFNSYTRQASQMDSLWAGELSVLYRATYRGHAKMVKTLIDHHADVDALGWADFSTCHAAAMSGSNEVTRLILEKSRKNVNATLSVSLNIPLNYAVELGFLDVTKTLLEKGADVRLNQRTSGYNSLHLAIREDVSSTIVYELVKSVKGHERQKLLDGRAWGDSAIHMAAEYASTSTIQTLLEFRANLEARTLANQDTALIVAARNGKYTTVRFLLEKGADVNAGNAWSTTALMIAAGKGLPKTTETLLEYKPNITATSRDGNTALHFAARNAGRVSCDCFERIIEMLVAKGASVNATNKKNQTPLDKAANRNDDDTIKLLRKYGAVLYKPNKDVRDKYVDFFDPDSDAELQTSLESLDDLSLSLTNTSTQDSVMGSEESMKRLTFDKEDESMNRLTFDKEDKKLQSEVTANKGDE